MLNERTFKLSNEAMAHYIVALQNALINGYDLSDYLRDLEFIVGNDDLLYVVDDDEIGEIGAC